MTQNESFLAGIWLEGRERGLLGSYGRTREGINRQPRLVALRARPGSAGLRNGKNRLSVVIESFSVAARPTGVTMAAF